VDCDAFGLTANVSGIKVPGDPLTCVICGAVDIVDRDRLSEGAHEDAIKLRPLDVNEATSGAAVNKGLSASSDHAIR
jgi:hypothetical protein